MAKGKGKAARMNVAVDAETHRLLETYSQLTGVPIGKVAARAVREWLNITGRVHLEVMTGQKYTDTLEVPVASAGTVPLPPGARGAAH